MRNPLAHPIDQYFAAASGDGTEPRRLEGDDDLAQWHPEHFREVLQLGRAEAVDIDVRILCADVREEIQRTVETECRGGPG